MCTNSGIIVLACKPETTCYSYCICFVPVTNANNPLNIFARKGIIIFACAWVTDVVL